MNQKRKNVVVVGEAILLFLLLIAVTTGSIGFPEVMTVILMLLLAHFVAFLVERIRRYKGERVESFSTSSSQSSRYAGFWGRLAANLIDVTIYIIGWLIFGLPFWIGGDMRSIQVSPLVFALSTVFSWLYFALLESSNKQATIGKMAVGIIVTDLDGKRISFGRASGRYFGKFLSSATLGVGFIMAGFTKKKQALHDIVADTLVMKRLTRS